MTPEQFEQVERLFEAVCEMIPAEAATYLDAHATDPEVRGQVEQLLAEDARENDRLQTQCLQIGDDGAPAVDLMLPVVYGRLRRLARNDPARAESSAEALRRFLLDCASHHGVDESTKAVTSALRLDRIVELRKPEEIAGLVAVDDALQRLGERDAQIARVFRVRFYGGLTIEQTAAALGLDPQAVERNWTFARAWLFREVS